MAGLSTILKMAMKAAPKAAPKAMPVDNKAVSYTHLTLPTILLV